MGRTHRGRPDRNDVRPVLNGVSYRIEKPGVNKKEAALSDRFSYGEKTYTLILTNSMSLTIDNVVRLVSTIGNTR